MVDEHEWHAIFEAGEHAFAIGLDRKYNPYPKPRRKTDPDDVIRHMSWQLGYSCAEMRGI
jgi:hypothetical protein